MCGYIEVWLYTNQNVYIDVVYIHTCTCMHTYIHSYMCVISAFMSHMHTHTHTHIYIYIYIYIYMYIYIYAIHIMYNLSKKPIGFLAVFFSCKEHPMCIFRVKSFPVWSGSCVILFSRSFRCRKLVLNMDF